MNREFRDHWPVVLAAAFGAGAGITGASVYSLSILIQPLTDAFGWSRGQVSAAKTVLTTGFILTAPLVGYVADRVGVRRIAMLSLSLLALVMFWMTQIGPSIESFYISLFVLAVAGGATTPLVWTRAVASWFRESRGLAMALTLSGTGVVGVVAPALLNFLIERYDWRAAYIAMGVFALLALIPIASFFRENRDAVTNKTVSASAGVAAGLSLREAAGKRVFWQIGAAFFLIGGAVSALMVHLVPLIVDAGLGRATAVAIAGALGLAVIFGRLLTGFLVDRFHPPYVAAAFLIMPVAGCMMLLGSQPTTLLVLLGVLCFGLAAGSEVDLVPFLTARYFGLRSYGKIYACMFIAFYAGVGLGPLLLGISYDAHRSYDVGLTYTIPVLIAGTLLVATLGVSRMDETRTQAE